MKKTAKYFLLNFIVCISYLQASDQDNYLIVANGPFNKELVKKYTPNHCTIALDGAANHFATHNLKPNFILGDMDSISDETKKIFQISEGISFVEKMNQDFTDLEKGIMYAKNKGAKKIIIVNALGGERTDHTIGNLSILKKQYDSSVDISIHNNKEIIQFLKDETIKFTSKIGEKFGLFGFPKAIASSSCGQLGKKGLRWELNNFPLEIGVRESSCNIIESDSLEIVVVGEALMVRPQPPIFKCD